MIGRVSSCSNIVESLPVAVLDTGDDGGGGIGLGICVSELVDPVRAFVNEGWNVNAILCCSSLAVSQYEV